MTAPITPDARAEWRALADAATKGPWDAHGVGSAGEEEPSSIVIHTGKFDYADVTDPDGTSAVAWTSSWGYQEHRNAEFIAAARMAVPRLLDALDTAEAERDEARAEVERLRAVREHLPTRPDRETVARTLRSFLPLTPEPALDSTAAAQADAVLALWPGRSEATVKAEALRDAAGILQASYDRDLAYPGSTNEADWLRALADRIAAEGGADRD